VEEDNSILLVNSNSPGTDKLQSPGGTGHPAGVAQPAAENSLKLAEAENKLNRVFEEYSGRIESFMLMLDALNEGLVLVNKAGEICFANESGNGLINEINESQNANVFAFTALDAEKCISVKPAGGHQINIRINNFLWNGEQCNIFLMNRQEVVENEVSLAAPANPALNEPFSELISYVQLIAEHEANGKTSEATACAELAAKTVVTSEKLLSDVKTFIALAHHQPTFTQLSMQKIVGDVLKSMGPEIEDAGIEVSVSDLPETAGDKELILKLVKQLVHNALKFRNKTRKAVIDIGHDKSDGQYIFCVRDNGIGISKKHHEQVFALFSTLNEAQDYPGNGMGLAICKKIVDMHDGKIWVESLPGHGSNFYFKLNAKQ
jgi:signal transduction histidine kinase